MHFLSIKIVNVYVQLRLFVADEVMNFTITNRLPKEIAIYTHNQNGSFFSEFYLKDGFVIHTDGRIIFGTPYIFASIVTVKVILLQNNISNSPPM